MTRPLADQIVCIRSELSRREREYPAHIAAHRMTQAWADYQMTVLQAVLVTLECLADEATTQLPLGDAP